MRRKILIGLCIKGCHLKKQPGLRTKCALNRIKSLFNTRKIVRRTCKEHSNKPHMIPLRSILRRPELCVSSVCSIVPSRLPFSGEASRPLLPLRSQSLSVASSVKTTAAARAVSLFHRKVMRIYQNKFFFCVNKKSCDATM